MPRLLDLFCCEGGAGSGYASAGFDVVGVDLDAGRRRHYPFGFHAGDVLAVLDTLLAGSTVAFTVPGTGQTRVLGLADFDAIHASPPCQAYSITRHSHSVAHAELVVPTRDRLRATGLPYLIENVPGAPLLAPLTLCGAALGRTATDLDGERLVLKRHRLFESNLALMGLECACADYRNAGYRVAGVYGGGAIPKGRYVAEVLAAKEHARHVRRGGYTPVKEVAAELIGAPWMTYHGLSQSIPPAYSEFLGEQVLARLAPSGGTLVA